MCVSLDEAAGVFVEFSGEEFAPGGTLSFGGPMIEAKQFEFIGTGNMCLCTGEVVFFGFADKLLIDRAGFRVEHKQPGVFVVEWAGLKTVAPKRDADFTL